MALDTNHFVEKLISLGYTHVCVVPCSFAKYLINAVINNISIEYIPCASEAVACSVAAGLRMAGKKPIVVIQSSGLTNMGSCITSLLKPYEVTFPILVSWRTYTEGSSEIQHQHLAAKLPELIHAYGYNCEIIDQANVENAVNLIDLSNNANIICLLKKNTFTKVELAEEHLSDMNAYAPRSDYLKCLNDIYKGSSTLFIGTTGNTAREMYSFMPDTNNFYMAGNMGGALSLGLGASLAGRKVIVCGGDAEYVMHMGGLATAGRYREKIDLTYILFDNEANKSTGGQNTYQSHISYMNIAKSCSITVVERTIFDLESFYAAIIDTRKHTGLKFICVKCGFDEETPRPPLNSVKVKVFKID